MYTFTRGYPPAFCVGTRRNCCGRPVKRVASTGHPHDLGSSGSNKLPLDGWETRETIKLSHIYIYVYMYMYICIYTKTYGWFMSVFRIHSVVNIHIPHLQDECQRFGVIQVVSSGADLPRCTLLLFLLILFVRGLKGGLLCLGPGGVE